VATSSCSASTHRFHAVRDLDDLACGSIEIGQRLTLDELHAVAFAVYASANDPVRVYWDCKTTSAKAEVLKVLSRTTAAAMIRRFITCTVA
jgi:hypothetical protein